MIVSFPVYVISITSFVGWFFFVLFGGVGLSALPMDLINEFLGRPVWVFYYYIFNLVKFIFDFRDLQEIKLKTKLY